MNDTFSWQNFINQETKKPYFKEIKTSLIKSNKAGHNIFPPPKDFFKAFEKCDYETTKIVIIGQDPYPTVGVANGLAFSVNKNIKIPASLKNIFKEIEDDLKIVNNHGDLTSWAEQGVLLLNVNLSVVEGKPGSHSKIGWEKFTDLVISKIQKKGSIIFLLWGNYAKTKKSLIGKNNYILEAAHPSPLSAHNGFFGCKHFSKANKILLNEGIKPIDWQLEE